MKIDKINQIISGESIEWRNLRQEIAELAKSTFQKAKDRLNEDDYLSWIEEFDDKMSIYVEEVRKSVPNYSQYVAWHALGGSTTDYKTSPMLDLPDPYSVKEFYKNIMNDLTNR